jgi:MFS family permease
VTAQAAPAAAAGPGSCRRWLGLFVTGAAAFAAASVLAALARSGPELIGSRVLQGIAAAQSSAEPGNRCAMAGDAEETRSRSA